MKKPTASEYDFSMASRTDALEIVKLVNSAYRGESSKQGWTTEADLLGGQRADYDGLVEDLERPRVGILLARRKSDQRLMGCVQLEQDVGFVYLGMLTIDPQTQSQGLGKILLAESEKRTLGWGFKKITLSVIAQRKELIDWYLRRGFKMAGRQKPFPYGNPRFGLPKRDDLFFEYMEKELE